MSNLIDRDALRKQHSELCPGDCSSCDYCSATNGKLFCSLIDNAPTIDAEPVRHGAWKEASGCRIICNNCGHYPLYDYFGRLKLSPYCWFCGLKMGGDKVGEGN